MSENINLQPQAIYAGLQAKQTEVIRSGVDTHEVFKNWLEQSSSQITELATNRQEIETAGAEMIDEFDIEPGLFDVAGRSLIFSAIANRWSKSADEPKERIFAEDALTLLAHDYSTKLNDIFEYAQGEGLNRSDEHRLAVYDKYTDQQMTGELKGAINNGLLHEVKAKLGITPENEDAYEVRVLSIGDFIATYGMSAPPVPDYNPFIKKSGAVVNQREFDDALLLQDMVHEWAKGLEIRQEAFAQELGQSALAPAWMTQMKGRTFLCMLAPTVEKILHPEVTTNSKYYTEQDTLRDLAYLQHEYVHTQGGINLGRGIDFGISIEELRAEEFSGNKHGYQDIKNFARDFGIVTGKDLVTYMDGKAKGGADINVYTELAQDIGLDRMLETVMVRPAPYDRDQSNLLNVMVADYIGGYDGIIMRLISDKDHAGKGQEIEERIDAAAKRYIEKVNPDFLPTYFSMREGYGNVLMTKQLEKRVQELTAEATLR